MNTEAKNTPREPAPEAPSSPKRASLVLDASGGTAPHRSPSLEPLEAPSLASASFMTLDVTGPFQTPTLLDQLAATAPVSSQTTPPTPQLDKPRRSLSRDNLSQIFSPPTAEELGRPAEIAPAARPPRPAARPARPPALEAPGLASGFMTLASGQATPPTPALTKPRTPLSPKTFVPPTPEELGRDVAAIDLASQETPPTPIQWKPRKSLSPKTFVPPTPEELAMPPPPPRATKAGC